MAEFSRTWWGTRFISALERFTYESRLQRGRQYARGKKVQTFKVEENVITATVEGSINAWFGVHKKPLYKVKVTIDRIPKKDWPAIIRELSKRAGSISKLLMGEIPDDIESVFEDQGHNLLPRNESEFTTSCSCPDFANPCKHIAGAYFLVAAELDNDPFLLFELRGINREKLQQELRKTPLGQALSNSMENGAIKEPEPKNRYFTTPKTMSFPKEVDAENFWKGTKPLPQLEDPEETGVPALLIKKQGDFPPFWQRDNSFLTAMETLYQRVKKKNGLL